MRANTLIMLLIALVFGGVAVFFANIWLNNQQRNVVQAPAPVAVETSTIVVAARDLAYGETLRPELLREIDWPRQGIPDGSYAKIADLTGDGGHVVLMPISPNEPVLKWKISGAGGRATLSATIKPGMRAVALRINEVVAVAGFVLPGDHVDLLYTKSGNGNNEGSTTDIIIQNIRVLAINQIADEKKSDPVVGTVATLEVTTLDAQKIALAQSTGSLSFTLRAAGSLDQAPAQRVVEQELVSSPSVYQAAMDQQNAAQAAADARIKQLEGELTNVAKKVDETSSKDKLATQAAIDARVKQLEGDLTDVAQKADETSSKTQAAVDARVKQLEGDLTGVAQKADETRNKDKLATQAVIDARVKQLEGVLTSVARKVDETSNSKDKLAAQLAGLAEAVNQTAKATGKGEEQLRAKLSALEAAIKQASNTSGEDELRAKLAQFEANLRDITSSAGKPTVVVSAPKPEAVAETKPSIVTVGVTRGTKRDTYVVPQEATQ